MALRNLRPPLTESEFEEAVRRDLLAEKLQSAVTSWVTVGRRARSTRNTAAATRR